MSQTFVKDPSEDLDYLFDFAGRTNGVLGASSDYLDVTGGEIIASYEIAATDGIDVGDSFLIKADTCVQVWLSGGTARARYRVTVTVITTMARTVERSILIEVRER